MTETLIGLYHKFQSEIPSGQVGFDGQLYRRLQKNQALREKLHGQNRVPLKDRYEHIKELFQYYIPL